MVRGGSVIVQAAASAQEAGSWITPQWFVFGWGELVLEVVILGGLGWIVVLAGFIVS